MWLPSTRFTLFSVLLVSFAAASSYPPNGDQIDGVPAIELRTTDPACEIIGNQDMYGLGIRIGIYLQLLTTVLIDAFGSPDHAVSITPGNLWFLIAMFVGLANFARDPSFNAAEGYIIVSLGSGITLAIMGGTMSLNPENIKEGCLSSFSRYILWALWKGYSTRFWWEFLDSPQKTGCDSFGWLFVKVKLFGWFRVFHKVLNICEWVVWGILVFPYPFGLILLLYFLVHLDTRGWGVSKFTIFIDYLFVPIGTVHYIVFGPVTHIYAPSTGSGSGSYTTSATNITSNKQAASITAPLERRDQIREYISSLDLFNKVFEEFSQGSQLLERRLKNHMAEFYGLPPQGLVEAEPPKPSFNSVWWLREFISKVSKRAGITRFKPIIVWDIFVLAFTICTVEISIVLNNIKEVNYAASAGQSISIVVGLGTILTALCEFYTVAREETRKDRRTLAP